MKDQVLDKITELSIRAQKLGSKDVQVHLSSSGTSLSKAIKTKEQADIFMQRLKAL